MRRTRSLLLSESLDDSFVRFVLAGRMLSYLRASPLVRLLLVGYRLDSGEIHSVGVPGFSNVSLA